LFGVVAAGVDPQKGKALAATLSLLWLGIMVITSLPGGIIYIARGGRKKSGSGYDIDVDKGSVVSAINPS
jgi:hypothetical protein